MNKENIIKSYTVKIKGKIVSVEQYLSEDFVNTYWRIKVNKSILYDRLKNKPDIKRYKYDSEMV